VSDERCEARVCGKQDSPGATASPANPKSGLPHIRRSMIRFTAGPPKPKP